MTLEEQYEAAFWYIMTSMWINMVFIRGFFTYTLKKFVQEACWMKQNPDHPAIGNSHPCGRGWGPKKDCDKMKKMHGAMEMTHNINMNPVYTGVPPTK